MSERVLVIATHPDDETLGCGGALLKHKKAGDQIGWGIVTSTKGVARFPDSFYNQRIEQIKQVEAAYGFDFTACLDLPATELCSLPLGQIIQRINDEIIKPFDPTTIIVPHGHDIHSDHRIVFNTIVNTVKSFRYPNIKTVLTMETLSETEYAGLGFGETFSPNFFVDITPHLKKKLEILKIYESEVAEHPFPRSERAVESLATLRGSMCNKEYAEAFHILKMVRD